MVNRLGANLNNPFEPAGRPAASRNLHLKTAESVSDRVKNLKNKTERKQGQFGEIVEAEIVGEETRRPQPRQQEKQFNQDPRFGSAQDLARKMQFERARAAAPQQAQELMPGVSRKEFEELKSEMRAMQSSLSRLMAGRNPNQSASINQGFSSASKPSSHNIGFGYGYELGNA